MPEIEDRLRAALDILADEVPRSIHARAELDRRLAGRGRRRRVPVWAAAAAVVVVAGAVAVPVLLNRGQPPSDRLGLTKESPSLTTSPPESTNLRDIPWPYRTPRSPIAWNDEEGAAFRELHVAISDDGEFCYVLEGRYENPVTREDECEPLPEWGPGHFVESRSLRDVELAMPATIRDQLADRLVFLVASEVTRLTVRRGDGSVLPLWSRWDQQVGVTAIEGQGFALADFAGPYDGFGYTAYDSAGDVLEEVIT
jgi:hypothetical protein